MGSSLRPLLSTTKNRLSIFRHARPGLDPEQNTRPGKETAALRFMKGKGGRDDARLIKKRGKRKKRRCSVKKSPILAGSRESRLSLYGTHNPQAERVLTKSYLRGTVVPVIRTMIDSTQETPDFDASLIDCFLLAMIFPGPQTRFQTHNLASTLEGTPSSPLVMASTF
eukprot:1161957-Pelagomonas_calceolata.AAC.1